MTYIIARHSFSPGFASAGAQSGLLCMQSCHAWHIWLADPVTSAARSLPSQDTVPITVVVYWSGLWSTHAVGIYVVSMPHDTTGWGHVRQADTPLASLYGSPEFRRSSSVILAKQTPKMAGVRESILMGNAGDTQVRIVQRALGQVHAPFSVII